MNASVGGSLVNVAITSSPSRSIGVPRSIKLVSKLIKLRDVVL
jgi:hypothetical protein